MKTKLIASIVPLFFLINAFSNGVAVKNATNGIYLKLITSEVQVSVFNQVATIVTTQQFYNNTGEDAIIKYAFPLNEEASATGLKWQNNNIWYAASFSPSPQDTSLPGGNDPDPDLMTYLGDSPLFFSIDDTIRMDSVLTVELTFVQLLPYEFSLVEFYYPNDYTIIQDDYVDLQRLNLFLESQRTIEGIELTSHPDAIVNNYGNEAEIFFEVYEEIPNTNYLAKYTLNSEELGLFSFSTMLADGSNDCDELGNGFFGFIVEPDPGDSTQILDKVFTLIVDKSGSMGGDKIVQARNAASFIVENLNEGDYFNIVDFNSTVYSFAPDHVEFNEDSKLAALNYISGFYSGGSTNISGAFSTAIADFAGNDTTIANIIIFFTDGRPTVGLTGTDAILNHIQDELSYNEVEYLMIHSFGIGGDVNMQLLSQIASQNNGLSEFLLDSELEEIITEFYLQIRNPVLLNIDMNFYPDVVIESYPNPLPNLYLGQQLIVVGRYQEAVPVNVNFTGEAFGQFHEYEYDFNLSDTLVENFNFLIKLWAKNKIENLYVDYFTFPPESPEAEEVKDAIIECSVCYNVSSPFTHLSGGGAVGEPEIEGEITESIDDSYAYPNPFGSVCTIRFAVDDINYDRVEVMIYDAFGRLIKIIYVDVNQPDIYSAFWDGNDNMGNEVPAGLYYYKIELNTKSLSGKMLKF